MAPKRKDGSGDELTGREKKKMKMTAARTIAVQSANTVSFSEKSVAGPSKVAVNGLNGLPSAIDVEKFAEARAFEIDAMHNAMKNASASSTSRAWQALPRHLRRRAASHDVRRVPLRLREKARAEMDPLHKKASGHSLPKLGKNKRLKRTELFAKRQREKSWLETHIWHAKRMKMDNLWGYRLAVHPTEKSYRPSHRASVHGSIIHDASYHSIIELKGTEPILKRALDTSCDPNGPSPGSRRYSSGSRALETYIYKSGSYPFGLISPITVIWKPLPLNSPSVIDEENKQVPDPVFADQSSSKRKRESKGKEKEKENSTLPDSETPRVVWIISHPSAYQDVLSSIRTSASLTLEAFRREDENKEVEIEIGDLRGQVNIFEIMGPKSNQVLKGALSPISQDKREDFKKFWSRFTNMQTSAEMSRGTVVGFKVVDPRLKFPPKNAQVQAPPVNDIPSTTVFPSAQLAQCDLWDGAVRTKLARPRYKKKDLDERRSKLLIPGTPLNPERQDDRIPVLLIQRSLEALESKTQGIHGWTLIIPSGWAMAFFSSLVYTGTRVGGQRERQTQAFEAGMPYFPRDLPTSVGYDTYATARAKEDKGRWDRKPPAKRPNYEKLGTSSPWRADWHGVLGLPCPKFEDEANTSGAEGFVSTQREPADEIGITDEGPQMWLLRGSEVPSVISNMSKMFIKGAAVLQEVNKLRAKRGLEALGSSIRADDLLKRALVSVRISMCGRGAPEDLAIIYQVSNDEGKKWERALRNPLGGYHEEETEEEEKLSEVIPPKSSIIGYVTTGHFSLSQGQGFGIGAIPLVKFLELREQAERRHTNTTSLISSLLVKVRNRSGQQCRAAHIEILAC
ncbi:hypothetical protein H2248_007583 [Termitomyces sp. 'cryptogamus']|nr:hypothetical protein H2248_007583 [Termitomyces sp. 'cryptogamus']